MCVINMKKEMISPDKMHFDRLDGLIPAVIIDNITGAVLMVGFMNRESLSITIATGKVTFYSRSREKIWTKGETSGNFLNVIEIKSDCDDDTLLIKAIPDGNTCHKGDYSCFKEEQYPGIVFLNELYHIIQSRKKLLPEHSYTTKLFLEGEDRIIQKVGEEAVETIIAAKNKDKKDLVNETSDLIYHLFVMLVEKGMPVREGRDRGHLRDEPDDVVVARLRVENLLGVRVERRKRADGREQHPHRVGVVPEALHELLDVLVEVRVHRDVLSEVLQLGCRRELALQKEPRDLEERRLLGQLLDRVTPVFEDPLVAVDERDRRLARRRIRERRVVGHEAEVVLIGLDPAQVEGANRPVLDGQLVRLPGAVVGDRERAFIGHRFLPAARQARSVRRF